MPDFSEFADEAKNLASDHPDMANKGIEEAGQVADEKTGGRFGSQIDEGEQRAEGFLARTTRATKTRRPETASEDEKLAGGRRLGICALRLGPALRFRAYGIAPDRLDAGQRGFVAFVVLAGSGECPPAWRLGGLASGRPPGESNFA